MKILAGILLTCTALQAQPPQTKQSATGMDAARLARIPARMQQFVDQGTAAGFVTLIARHGQIASLAAVGYQDREAKVPMRTDTIFRIKSLTKPITAAGIMLLVDEGRISLLDPIEQYIPEFKGIQLRPCGAARPPQQCDLVTASRLITIRDLLTHTSGLRDPFGNNAPVPLAERISTGARNPLVSEPGTVWRYSNFGYGTLGRIIEVVSGEPYDTFITERLIKPLDMTDTFYFPPADKQARVAAVYTVDPSGKLIRAPGETDPDTAARIPSPEGGLYSTAADQFAFYQMLLDKGVSHNKRILSIPAVEAITTNQTGDLKGAEFSPGLGMGLGFGVVKEPLGTFRYQSIGTFMKGGAYRTLGFADPSRDLVGIIMYQRTNGGGDTALETTIFVTLAEAAISR